MGLGVGGAATTGQGAGVTCLYSRHRQGKQRAQPKALLKAGFGGLRHPPAPAQVSIPALSPAP